MLSLRALNDTIHSLLPSRLIISSCRIVTQITDNSTTTAPITTATGAENIVARAPVTSPPSAIMLKVML